MCYIPVLYTCVIYMCYTCDIYMCYIHVLYTCVIYMCYIHVLYTCVIYMCDIHVLYTCVIYMCYTSRVVDMSVGMVWRGVWVRMVPVCNCVMYMYNVPFKCSVQTQIGLPQQKLGPYPQNIATPHLLPSKMASILLLQNNLNKSTWLQIR